MSPAASQPALEEANADVTFNLGQTALPAVNSFDIVCAKQGSKW
jgi:hypothetical protein